MNRSFITNHNKYIYVLISMIIVDFLGLCIMKLCHIRFMDSIRLFKSRRTIHNFNKKKVSEDIILEAIEAANFAPCHRNTFPWRYYGLGDHMRSTLSELFYNIKTQNSKLSVRSKELVISKILNPSHLIFASQVISNDSFQAKEDYAACSCSIQNLMLSLASNGVGSKWSTGEIISSSQIYDLLNISQSKEEIIALLFIGYGDTPNDINRPTLDQIYSHL